MNRYLIALLAAALAANPAAAARPGGEFRFSDVPPNHWAVDHVRRVVSAGLMQGYDGRFLGNGPMNRYQMAHTLSRLLDRMGNQSQDREGGPSNEVFLQIADEVASLNVAQSNLEEKLVQLRHDIEAVKGGDTGHDGSHARRVPEEEWTERLRTQGPAAFAAMAVFASAGFLRTLK